MMAYLQSVGEDDVGVHGTHVQVVDDGILQAVGTVPQHGQFVHNVTAHLVITYNHVTVHLEITQPCHCTPGDHIQPCHCTPGDHTTMLLHTW